MLITPLFTAVFAFFYVFLSLNVIKQRFANKISLGSADSKEMERAIRTHANFIEYVPIALILFYFIEMLSMSSNLVFYLGSALLIGRVMHFFGMQYPQDLILFRKLGMIITLLVLLVASIALALRYLPISV